MWKAFKKKKNVSLIEYRTKGESDTYNSLGHWILWGITFFNIRGAGLGVGLCRLTQTFNVDLLKLRNLWAIQESMFNRPLVKWILSPGGRFKLEVCIQELAGMRIVEAMCTHDMTHWRYKKWRSRKDKSDHIGGHWHHTSVGLVTQAWTQWVSWRRASASGSLSITL